MHLKAGTLIQGTLNPKHAMRGTASCTAPAAKKTLNPKPLFRLLARQKTLYEALTPKPSQCSS